MIVLRSNNQLYIVFTFFDEGYFLGNTSIVYDIIGGILHVFNVEKHILKKFKVYRAHPPPPCENQMLPKMLWIMIWISLLHDKIIENKHNV